MTLETENLDFSIFHTEITALLNKAALLEAQANLPAGENSFSQIKSRFETSDNLRLAFVGGYSSGKSSLIKALTGCDIKTGADVCTDEVAEYTWNGLKITDTPGVKAAEEDTLHDQRTKDGLLQADLIFYVVTNEMFNPKLAQYLKHILTTEDGGLGLSQKTALIINKIDREDNDHAILREQAEQVLAGENTPIFLCSAGKYLESLKAPEALKERFKGQSKISELADFINQFVRDNGKIGKLMTPVTALIDRLDQAAQSFAASEADKEVLELLRREEKVLRNLEDQIFSYRRTAKNEIKSLYDGLANERVPKIHAEQSSEVLTELAHEGFQMADKKLERIFEETSEKVKREVMEAEEDWDKIAQSDFARHVRMSFLEKGGSRQEVKFTEKASTGADEYLKHTAKFTKQLEDGIKHFSKPENLMYFFRNSGKRAAKKAAEQSARRVAMLGKALPYAAAGVEFYMNFREEQKKEEAARRLSKIKVEFRKYFHQETKAQLDVLKRYFEGQLKDYLDAIAKELAEEKKNLMSKENAHQENSQKCDVLKNEALVLREKISTI